MTRAKADKLTISMDKDVRVSALLDAPKDARAALAFAHGAGAGMEHPFMAEIAAGMATRGIACLRYQFPYMEKGGKRPDPPKLAQATVRAAVATLGQRLPGLPLFAGGKSFGGRMTSQAQSESPLSGVRGLAFFGFPLHQAGKPSRTRGDHLFAVKLPMLFLQGTRDSLAALTELEPLCRDLGKRATLRIFDQADHSFHVPAKSGRTDAEIRQAMLDDFEVWTDAVIRQKSAKS